MFPTLKTCYRLIARRIAMYVAVVLLATTAGTASAKAYRTVVESALHGETGEVVTCIEMKKPVERTLTFTAGTARVKVTVVQSDEKGKESTQRFDSEVGVPMIDGPIKKVTVEFLTRGTCKIHLYADEKAAR